MMSIYLNILNVNIFDSWVKNIYRAYEKGEILILIISLRFFSSSLFLLSLPSFAKIFKLYFANDFSIQFWISLAREFSLCSWNVSALFRFNVYWVLGMCCRWMLCSCNFLTRYEYIWQNMWKVSGSDVMVLYVFILFLYV